MRQMNNDRHKFNIYSGVKIKNYCYSFVLLFIHFYVFLFVCYLMIYV